MECLFLNGEVRRRKSDVKEHSGSKRLRCSGSLRRVGVSGRLRAYETVSAAASTTTAVARADRARMLSVVEHATTKLRRVKVRLGPSVRETHRTPISPFDGVTVVVEAKANVRGRISGRLDKA